MTDTRADELVQRMNQDMRQALKNNQPITLNELRSLLAWISNAQAVPVVDHPDATEVPRKTLTFDDIQEILAAEMSELQEALNTVGQTSPYSDELRGKIAVVEAYQER